MSNPAWTIPDEEPVTCEGCGLRSYDTENWTHDEWDSYCPDHTQEVTPSWA